MAQQIIIVKNLNLYDVEIEDLGFIIPLSSERTLTDEISQDEILTSNDLYSLVESSTLIINDGISDLSVVDALEFLTIETLKIGEGEVIVQDSPAIQVRKRSAFVGSSTWQSISFDTTDVIDNNVFSHISDSSIEILEDGLYGITYTFQFRNYQQSTDSFFKIVDTISSTDILGSHGGIIDGYYVGNSVTNHFVANLTEGMILNLMYMVQSSANFSPPVILNIVKLQGVKGIQGVQGGQGVQGIQGETGADSTVPGPQGPQGDPGVSLDVHNESNTFSNINDLVFSSDFTVTNPTSDSINIVLDPGVANETKLIQVISNTSINMNTVNGKPLQWNITDIVDTPNYTVINNYENIRVEQDGLYEITYSVNSDQSHGNRKTVEVWVELNGDYVQISSSYAYMRNSTDNALTNNNTFLLQMENQDNVIVKGKRWGSSGDCYSIENECHLIIKKIR